MTEDESGCGCSGDVSRPPTPYWVLQVVRGVLGDLLDLGVVGRVLQRSELNVDDQVTLEDGVGARLVHDGVGDVREGTHRAVGLVCELLPVRLTGLVPEDDQHHDGAELPRGVLAGMRSAAVGVRAGEAVAHDLGDLGVRYLGADVGQCAVVRRCAGT